MSTPQAELASERVIVQAPMSFTGSARRIWRITRHEETAYRIALGICAVALIGLAWLAVLAWYVLFGLLLVPYRLIRRGSRKRKREGLMHREQLNAIESLRSPADATLTISAADEPAQIEPPR